MRDALLSGGLAEWECEARRVLGGVALLIYLYGALNSAEVTLFGTGCTSWRHQL